MQFDFDNEDGKSKPFPPEIAVVSGVGSRPDGEMWSMATKTVIWIELTSPWEENLKKELHQEAGQVQSTCCGLEAMELHRRD